MKLVRGRDWVMVCGAALLMVCGAVAAGCEKKPSAEDAARWKERQALENKAASGAMEDFEKKQAELAAKRKAAEKKADGKAPDAKPNPAPPGPAGAGK